ncbi:2-oxoglutarate carboxylase small subunit [Candidatus Izimaplasma bacterium HR1]|jgi:acetyl-CoA carboxylase biotin carboxylase subunit|uniref:acetyl-CoA carboxylase biotin carboxylase subunit n=1 Tax=Candidatus Izimoplasma sp. HR1 TaxID=1541959 RepID=UPI0004F92D15|nr:2-oxoglutarate carboxylase small subunit [Candidatus Izimaplasma bacterium HR1]
MFQKILIANRGEIAVRIIRACKQLGIETVAIYSEADKNSLHTQIADEAVCVGGNKSSESYLNMENIISAAISKGAEAVHPGFGFLSENARFAELCESCGIRFIGPKGEVIDKMGNKARAREIMIASGVPVVPGSDGKVDSLQQAKSLAVGIGYPVLIKASAGGGGRGMRVAYTESEFDQAYETARSEAKNAFGDDTMYLEKYVLNPKHIEFQIIADKYGNTVHLGERDCSIQRRNQKVIEEAPSLISDDLRKRMGDAAIKASKTVNYENAGTIEFLVNGNDFYFIEMNTRIQVEHPVTEMVTGIDIIKEQIKITGGEPLSFSQEDINLNGHSIEVRINAENPKENFRPAPGKIDLLHVPSGHGVRFDSFIYTGYSISPFYDSMMGKVIVHGKTRLEAINKMKATLDELVISGVSNNREFCLKILENNDYVKGNFDTGFIPKYLDSLIGYPNE